MSLGLQKLHDLNVLHRDIKSGNILLDGAPGTCNSCDHSGLWKICDFGEAKVLKNPSLNFGEPQRFPKGWSHELVNAGRFREITSPFLKAKGAKYCKKLTPFQMRSAFVCGLYIESPTKPTHLACSLGLFSDMRLRLHVYARACMYGRLLAATRRRIETGCRA